MSDSQKNSIKEDDQEIEKLKEYRKSVVDQILIDEKEYHTSITYIAAGALALFLTINEKIFNIIESRQLWTFIASLSFLFITLVLYIFNIVSDIAAHETLRDSADQMLKNKSYDKPKLLKEWEKLIGKSRWLTYCRMFTLALGIFLEVWFIVANMNSKKDANQNESKIEIILPPKNSSKIMLDTSGSNIKIHFINK